MSGGFRDPYERLLRWYPRTWRAQHGAVLMATLRDVDDAGRSHPSHADMWSIRIHGTAERLTPTVGWVLATAGALASVLQLALMFVALGVGREPAATGWASLTGPLSVTSLLLTACAPALGSLGVVAFLRSVRVLGNPVSVLASGSATVAWMLAALASAAWGVGFERADTGLAPTPFSNAAAPLFWTAVAAGAVAVVVVLDSLLAGRWSRGGGRGAAARTPACSGAAPGARRLGCASAEPRFGASVAGVTVRSATPEQVVDDAARPGARDDVVVVAVVQLVRGGPQP